MGRRRKSGKREPNGRIQRNPHRDHGTPEVQLMRLGLNVDPTKTSCPLDLLFAKGIIGENEHQAGMSLSVAYKMVHRAHPQVVDFDKPHGGGEPSPEYLKRVAKAERRLGKVLALLKAESRQHYDQVINVAVFERLNFPPVCRSAKHRGRLKVLKRGLAILTRGHGLRRNPVHARHVG